MGEMRLFSTMRQQVVCLTSFCVLLCVSVPTRVTLHVPLTLHFPAGTLVFGKLLGMRDELRQVAPGVLVGLGSMAATGGMRNCAPFVLYERKEE